MLRFFVTGSADGLGYGAAQALLADGHEVVVHVRARDRLSAVQPLVALGAEVVVGDLSDLEQTREVAEQVNRIGRMDGVIHNAGVYTGSAIFAVNVVAPYILTALMTRPERLVYLSSGMHLGGRPDLGAIELCSYSDSKLYVTTLAAAIARRWPEVASSSVDPGWVPTRMGGPNAPDDLRLGHLTQVWLATSRDDLPRDGYWHHQRSTSPHSATRDIQFQDDLLERLAQITGVLLPE